MSASPTLRLLRPWVFTATAFAALSLGLMQCLLVAPSRDEFMSGATSSGGGAASSSGATGGSGASGAGGGSCQVEKFMELGTLVLPLELASSDTHVFWSTRGDDESLVQSKAKQGEADAVVVARLAPGREPRFISSVGGRLFWVALGDGKDTIDTEPADGGAPLEVLETGTSRAFAATASGLLWSSAADNVIHVLAVGDGGTASDAGSFVIPDDAGVVEAVTTNAGQIIATVRGVELDRAIWQVAGEQPCAACTELVKKANKAHAVTLSPEGNAIYWLRAMDSAQMIEFFLVEASASYPLLHAAVAPNTESLAVTATHVFWVAGTVGGGPLAEWSNGVFRVDVEGNNQKPERIQPAEGCEWVCDTLVENAGRLVTADADYVYWSCVADSNAVVFRSPVPKN